MQLTPLTSRKPYNKNTRKLVIAFDVGTTFSGASFAKLEPGMVPNIQGVTRYPAQHKVGGNSKIPSILYYDKNGAVKAVGAEAMDEAFLEEAQDEGYFKVEWFKLHLRPKTLSFHVADKDLPPLPPGKRPIDIFADYLKYLFDCTRKFIVEMNYNGESYWTSVKDNIDFVLTHPNGWEGRQQSLMRQAAVKAGLTEAGNAQARVQFVTEGEASLHYCLAGGTLNTIDNTREGMIIVDAGGGTLDLSAYKKTSGGPGGHWSFEEVAPIQCRLQGSIFVTRRARAYLTSRLSGTRFADDVNHISETFDATTKLGFRDRAAPYYIRFGGMRDTDRLVDVRNGQMKLAGELVAGFFQPSVDAVIEAVRAQQAVASVPIKTIIMVGGFAASEWLFSSVRTALGAEGLMVYRPDGHVNKAVADGAVSYYLDHVVNVRTAKFSYGIEVAIDYVPSLTEHKLRQHLIYTGVSGRRLIPGAYSEILARGTTVNEEAEFRMPYCQEYTDRTNANNIECAVMCYRGEGLPPVWLAEDKASFSTLCSTKANTTALANQLTANYNSNTGKYYYILDYEVVLLLGMTELKAQVAWKEKGQEKRCAAVVVYDDE
ncbi:hypothetical protein CYLTODRAFT_102547 [Cylindrobasidium torrendii FP15055 ss-10]|uniref:Actin-like ATPase domain-containing protein n=1 Tax=Cylindrobasidium torrendii FP15055 ss-10 TaxID=1314674 RepID=A0A0D7B1M2_9AGAR|nr:hypothetical protein CYLTODRAFT_102547 [Cylindrobasidium torrendii FP15055 ss-10]